MNVGVDVDLAHTALDAALDFLDRYAIGILDVTAKLANDGQKIAGRLAGEFVGAVAGANGNGQPFWLAKGTFPATRSL